MARRRHPHKGSHAHRAFRGRRHVHYHRRRGLKHPHKGFHGHRHYHGRRRVKHVTRHPSHGTRPHVVKPTPPHPLRRARAQVLRFLSTRTSRTAGVLRVSRRLRVSRG